MNLSDKKQLERILQETFSFDHFRDGQQQAIEKILAGSSALAIFPTGSGKSLCYQFCATQLPHLTIVVSPLLALIEDQLDFLKSKNIASASINSTTSYEELQSISQQLRLGALKILMVSVERFKNERFRALMDSVPISLLVIDEAHCISEWGHNFRPDYLKLPQYQQQLNIPQTLLLTATATPNVQKDMAGKFNISSSGIVQTGFYRKNLSLEIRATSEKEKNTELLSAVNKYQGAGIVYVTQQQTAQEVANFLSEKGISASAYHAGFDSERRSQIQQSFMNNDFQIIVATIAFGMGIDKSDIRLVVHYDLPKSIENYSQEIGRAGRDGLLSHCVNLANLTGLTTLQNFVYGDTPELWGINHVIETIKSETQNGIWELQGLSLSNDSNIKQLPLKTLLVYLELKGVLQARYSYFAEFKFKFVLSENEILAKFSQERQEFLTTVFSFSEKKKVWCQPNIEAIQNHYRCDRARIIAALDYLHEQQYIVLESKKSTEVFNVNAEALFDANLANELYKYFQSKEEAEVLRLAQLVNFFDDEKCLSQNLANYFGDYTAPEVCGHCSNCLGLYSSISSANEATANKIDPSELVSYIHELEQKLSASLGSKLTLVNKCRFLTGISAPVFARKKVNTLKGYAKYSDIPFAQVKAAIESVVR